MCVQVCMCRCVCAEVVCGVWVCVQGCGGVYAGVCVLRVCALRLCAGCGGMCRGVCAEGVCGVWGVQGCVWVY